MHASRLVIAVGRSQGSDPGRQPSRRAAAPVGAVDDASAHSWPFRRRITPADASPPALIRLLDLHRAFPAGQTAGTRLVLTQATYQLQRWLDWLDAHPGVQVFADFSAAAPAQAREAFSQRGPWAKIAVEAVPARVAVDAEPQGDDEEPDEYATLRDAFVRGDPEDRWRLTRRWSHDFPDLPALQLAYASACMELGRVDDAHGASDRALALAPDWEAVHFERGKLWLRTDDTEQAATAFAEAGRLMPSFSAAFSNLGAALGELDRQDEALEALKHALEFDPFGHAILNNIGAAARELGRLDEAESAFRLAVTHAPQFVFGHYNLGHTFFLQGRFAESRQAYEAGLAADIQKSPRQRCRAALACAAAGDAATAEVYFRQSLSEVDDETRAEFVNESAAVLRALLAVSDMDTVGIAALLDLLERVN